MEVNEIIKELRLQNGMTQEELASKLGLKKSAIAKYENGRVENIKRSTILKMSEIFGCTPAYILGMEDPSASVRNDRFNRLLAYYNKLNDLGVEKLEDRLKELIDLGYSSDSDSNK